MIPSQTLSGRLNFFTLIVILPHNLKLKFLWKQYRMRIEELTFFRFLAASIVVIFHFGRDETGLSGFLSSGPQMVTFFFVLSGFVLGISYLNKEIDKVLFWWTRIAKIMPVYLLALGMVVFSIYMQGRRPNSVSLVLNLTLLQSWFSPYPLSINDPGWALSNQAFFYFTFPFIIYVVKTRHLSARKMLAISLSIWIVTQAITTMALSNVFYSGNPSFFHDLIYYFPLTHFCSFVLGVSGAAWIMANNNHQIDNEFISFAFVGAVMCLIVVLLNNQAQISQYAGLKFAFGSSFFAPLFLIFIITITQCRSKTIKLFSAWPLVLLGEASYSFYILQKPIHWIFYKYVSCLFCLPPLQNFVAFFFFLTVVSILSFLLFEKPANKFITSCFLHSQKT